MGIDPPFCTVEIALRITPRNLHHQWSFPIIVIAIAMRRMVRRRKWVEFRWRWRRSRQVNENDWPDMVCGLPSLSSQGTAQYPYQKSQQKIDGSDEKIERMVMNESVKVFQSRRFQFECFYLPRLHDVLLMPRRFAPLVRGCGFQ